MSDEFEGVFRYFQKQHKPLKLLNGYKGMPVVSEVHVLYVGASSIIVKPESSQLVCLRAQQKTYIRDELFPRTVEARVSELDLVSGEVALTGFHYSGPGVGERRHLRVSPDDPILCVLQRVDLQESVHGTLVDLSREGLAVQVSRLYPPTFIQLGNQVIAQIHLPVARAPSKGEPEAQRKQTRVVRPDIDGRALTLEQALYKPPVSQQFGSKTERIISGSSILGVQGVIVNFSNENVDYDRIGLHLAQRHAANELMLRFITYRQGQIIRELKAIYAELLREEQHRRSQHS